MNKKDMLKRLNQSDLFRDALANVIDESERNAIKAISEKFISDLADAVLPLVLAAKTTSDVEQVAREIEHVFSGSVNISGSK
jgi:hypothetical protein